MVEDEGRFGRIGEARACWCPKGIRPVVPKQQVREYIYAGSCCGASGRKDDLSGTPLCQYTNDEFISPASLEKIFLSISSRMQVDKAAWHRSKSLEIPENIRLLPQPSYSPELMRFCAPLGGD